MFVVIEWIDWSWKGTQVKLIEENLKKIWKKVKILDYPRYWETSAFMVEKYLNWEYGKEISAKKASIFYAIDRFDHSIELKKDLKKYDFIISNRYVSASMIHQAGKIADYEQRKEFIYWLENLEYDIFGIKKPDKTIFLNVSPELSQKLVLEKKQREYLKWWKKMDLHEEDKDHLKNAHDTAMEIVSSNPDWIKIDCESDNWEMKSIEEINEIILKNILK